jgi:hypothetical protein
VIGLCQRGTEAEQEETHDAAEDAEHPRWTASRRSLAT